MPSMPWTPFYSQQINEIFRHKKFMTEEMTEESPERAYRLGFALTLNYRK